MVLIRYEVVDLTEVNGSLMTQGHLSVLDMSGPMTIKETFRALSGGWGRGSIPHGRYRCHRPTQLPDTDQYKAYRGESFPWAIPLDTPDYVAKTGRGDFAIHADGNFKGTLGCVCPVEDDARFYNLIKSIYRDNLFLEVY